MKYVSSFMGGEWMYIQYPCEPPLRERLAFLTNVLEMTDGSEERIRLRHKYRRELQCTYKIPPAETNIEFLTAYRGIRMNWLVPMWQQARKLATSDINYVQGTIYCDVASREFPVNGFVMIYDMLRINTHRIFEITGYDIIDANRITVAGGNVYDSAGNSWGTPYLVPMARAHTLNDIARSVDGQNATVDITYFCDESPYFHPAELTGATLFLGSPIYDDWYGLEAEFDGNSVRKAITIRTDINDFDTGLITHRSPWYNARVRFPVKFTTQDNLNAVYRLLMQMAGRLNVFWFPFYERMLEVVDTGYIGTSLTIKNVNSLIEPREYVLVKFHSGNPSVVIAPIPVRLSNGILTGIGEVTYTVTPALNFAVSKILFVVYIGICRLDADSIEINHGANGHLEMTIPIIELTPY